MKVLREILRNQPARFKNYAELTIMKTLEAHKDPHKEVGNWLFFKVMSRVKGLSEKMSGKLVGSHGRSNLATMKRSDAIS